MDAALAQLRAEGFNVRDEDVARLSPLGYELINVLGRYAFTLPETVARGQLRPLRDPRSATDEPDEPGLTWLFRSVAPQTSSSQPDKRDAPPAYDVPRPGRRRSGRGRRCLPAPSAGGPRRRSPNLPLRGCSPTPRLASSGAPAPPPKCGWAGSNPRGGCRPGVSSTVTCSSVAVISPSPFLWHMLGTNRPGVTLALRPLKNAGLIGRSRGQVTVPDGAGLEAAADGSRGAPEAECARLFGPPR